jgi:predicted Zn finger-like uncharacterized protein
MSDSFVTQCPHCQTSFRVSHAQLSVARGVVRCGACLQVFNAARQLLEQRDRSDEAPVVARTEPETAHAAPAILAQDQQSATSRAAEDDDPWHVSELDLDNLNLDEELARLEKRDAQRQDAPAEGEQTTLIARRDTSHSEEATWVGQLHNDEVERLPELHAEVASLPAPTPRIEAQSTRTEPSLGRDRDTDEQDHADPSVGHSENLVGARGGKTERWSARDDDIDDDDEDPATQDPRSRRGRNEPGLRDPALLDLNDDPLQLDWQRPKPRWGRRLAWGLLILLALAGLAVQYIWYHFDQLARQDQYRPWFQQLCPQLGCKVPSKVDISLLKSSNLIVRSHPEFQGALVVDAIIYNRASFSQPFPLLELRFADTGGQLIASRRFKPSEYLSGEMAGKEEMPPQTPIHIALDILDPGAKAVNYSLYFRSPE